MEAVFWSGGCARHALADTLGFSRSKANALAAGLLEQGLLDETGLQHSTGGRRAETLRLHDRTGVVFAVDIGATSLDVALMRPDLSILAKHSQAADVQAGPGPIMARLRSLLPAMLAAQGIAPEEVLSVGIGVPGPVNFAVGQLVAPPLMPGWDSFSIRDDMREITPAPIYVDNDVNVMALGVLWRQRRQIQDSSSLRSAPASAAASSVMASSIAGRRARPAISAISASSPKALSAAAAIAAASRRSPPRPPWSGWRKRPWPRARARRSRRGSRRPARSRPPISAPPAGPATMRRMRSCGVAGA